MDVTLFAELVTTAGLPVAMIIAMGVFIFLLWKQSKEREEKLYTELSACRAVNAKAIETLALYTERLGTIEADVKEIKDVLTR